MLLSTHISNEAGAKMLILFGGNPERRDEIIRHLQSIPSLSVIGTLSEEEGIQTIKSTPRVDFVLIGGRYSADQRKRIKNFIREFNPTIKITEPGVDYPYHESLIIQKIRSWMY